MTPSLVASKPRELAATALAACVRAASAISSVSRLAPRKTLLTVSATAEGKYMPPHQCWSPFFIVATTPGEVKYSSLGLNERMSRKGRSILTGLHGTRPRKVDSAGLW